jgi:putative drug exporter of the RND superfamily
MGALARWSFRHRIWVLLGWLVIVGALFAGSNAMGTRYSTSFSLPNTDSAKALNLLQANAPAVSGDTEQIVVSSNGGATLTTPVVKAQVNALLAKLGTLTDVKSMVSPYSAAGRDQMTASQTMAFANLTHDKVADALSDSQATNLVNIARSFDTPQLTVNVEGQVATNANATSLGGVIYGVIGAAVVLLIVFGSLLAMLLPLLAAGLALFASLGTVGMLTHAMSIVDFTSEVIPLIGLGVGIDYALFIVTRYRQGLRAGLGVESAVVNAVKTSGRAVMFAGTVVCIALLGMFVLGLSVLNGVAVAASFAVAFTMLTSTLAVPPRRSLTSPRLSGRRWRFSWPWSSGSRCCYSSWCSAA